MVITVAPSLFRTILNVCIIIMDMHIAMVTRDPRMLKELKKQLAKKM